MDAGFCVINLICGACLGVLAEGEVDVNISGTIIQSGDKAQKIGFEISGFDKQLVETGGWVEYADQNY